MSPEESVDPQNQLEVDLLERVAATTWSFERANRAEGALAITFATTPTNGKSARRKKPWRSGSGCSGMPAGRGKSFRTVPARERVRNGAPRGRKTPPIPTVRRSSGATGPEARASA